jgi:PPK2 family polyphosphate:nucleotide phosphotransferase
MMGTRVARRARPERGGQGEKGTRLMADLRPKRITELIAPYRVEPGRRVRLSRDFPTDAPGKFSKGDAKRAKQVLEGGVELLAEYQQRLAAQDTYGLLVIIQAIDAAGKDGTIRHVMSGVNPQGVEVHSFKVPSAEEQDHDYLWRYARRLPARGSIGIFNRSYYEEVLVVRVHPEFLGAEKLPASSRRGDIWRRRFREINDWERYLADQGFKIVKLFLNVSNEEQRRRFLDRIDEPEKNWKFSAADVKERARWDAYQKAFADMLSNTSTPWAPWYVIPADDKPYARLVAASAIANALIEINPRYPATSPAARAALEQARLDLMAEAPAGASADPNVPPAEPAGKGRRTRAKGKRKAKR